MSKASLRKELESFAPEQLRQIILAAYSASPEAKEYFEFFLNPDADVLLDKKSAAIEKELSRSRYGRSKARISVVRKTIRGFAAFGVGPSYHAELIFRTLRHLLRLSNVLHFPDPLQRGMVALAPDYLSVASEGGFMENAADRLGQLLTEYARPHIRRLINEELAACRKQTRK